MRYIMIIEDGSIYKSDEFLEEHRKEFDEGYLDIIDTATMKQWTVNGWEDIEDWNCNYQP